MNIDTLIAYENGELSAEQEACAMQAMLNAGQWALQGSYGRAMMRAIEAGVCMLGPNPAQDYWGNRIPSRTEVAPGTKGSRELVVERYGEAWATMLEGVR